MSTTTTNYELLKPELSDSADITAYNTNWDKIDSELANRVPTTRKINGKELSSDVTLGARDVGARPDTWTPSAEDVGAANTNLSNVSDEVFKEKAQGAGVGGGSIVIPATSSNGTAYSATTDKVTELYAGLRITIIPDRVSAALSPTLDLNGYGSKSIIMPIDGVNTGITTNAATLTTWLGANMPVELMYDGTRWRSEIKAQSAQYMYGTLDVEGGGTGATTAAAARTNLGITPANIGAATTSHYHAAEYVTSGTLGGQVAAKPSAVSDLETAQVRNISAGTTDLTAGTSSLATGDLYFVYE